MLISENDEYEYQKARKTYMSHPEYNSVDAKTGNVTYNGPLSLEKGDHSHMPARTEAYLPGDERGHVNASSLSGANTSTNIVPQHADVNHGAYLSVEKGERAALQSGAAIESEKTAVVDGQPGNRPSGFMINDAVTYSDGHTESLHHSFLNESYAIQSTWNDLSASLPGTFDALNPGDGLRNSMDTESYSALMQETDASLPNLDADYVSADYSGLPGEADAGSASYTEAESEADSVGAGSGGETDGADAGDGDGGTSADID